MSAKRTIGMLANLIGCVLFVLVVALVAASVIAGFRMKELGFIGPRPTFGAEASLCQPGDMECLGKPILQDVESLVMGLCGVHAVRCRLIADPPSAYPANTEVVCLDNLPCQVELDLTATWLLVAPRCNMMVYTPFIKYLERRSTSDDLSDLDLGGILPTWWPVIRWIWGQQGVTQLIGTNNGLVVFFGDLSTSADNGHRARELFGQDLAEQLKAHPILCA